MKRMPVERIVLLFIILNAVFFISLGLFDVYLAGSLVDLDKEMLAKVSSQIRNLNIAVVLITPILFVIGYIVVYKSLLNSINSVNNIIKKIADGDLTLNLEDCPGILGSLTQNINNLIVRTRQSFRMTKRNMIAIKCASDELKQSQTKVINELKMVEDNSSSISSAAEELSATSSHIVDSCKSSLDGTVELSKNADVGMERANGLKTTINEIASSINSLNKNITDFIKRYEQIEKFTATINDIADQTNLLALNAAIEAARAGESGRGFAVVADEVRKLSIKTTDSTKEIKAVISSLNNEMKMIKGEMSDSVRKIDFGVEITQETIENFENMNSNIKDIVIQLERILRSTEEESMAVNDISQSITNVSKKLEGLVHSSEEFLKAWDTILNISLEVDREISAYNIGKNDTLISWSSKIETGVKKFDEQHKELVRLLNKFYSSMNDGSSNNVLGNILKELANYTVYHFQSEEDAFKRYNFPMKDEHMRSHKNLVDQVVKIIKDFESGKEVVSVNLLQFLKEWVINHIIQEDKEYSKYFKSINAKID
ncbi:MAG: bacteriohemerythrin [Calditerrivibrio sp.]|nr:bacteriohemerythrin [Calditerrivibrio sp.]MCA1933046.1 bacteriohemerythrin [Calditerrivibrio sp.]MCA1980925.1 bacteriohemerythrin [Calditerrivibrio sp.]